MYRHWQLFAGFLMLFISCELACGEDHAWQVRRMRTCDAEKAGGYPLWDVQCENAGDGQTVTISGDRGQTRGLIYVGRTVRVPEDDSLCLALSYTTQCALEHRSGNLSLAVFAPEAWNVLGNKPRTELIDGQVASAEPLWRSRVHSMSGPDVPEPKPLDDVTRMAMSGFLRAHAGRELVLAVVWQGAHHAAESAQFTNLHIEQVRPEDPMAGLFDRLDLERESLHNVQAALEEDKPEAALQALVTHFRNRWKQPQPEQLSRGSWKDVDAALENRFRSIGSPDYFKLGTDFTWSRNAIDDKEWLLHLQWHHILKSLVEAGAIKEDERYTKQAAELIRDWIPKNYPGSPWSWRTLEVSLRAMNWTTIYRYLAHYEGLALADHARFLNCLAQHADYLLPEERFHSGHNFGATECKALLTVGFAFPEFKSAQRWTKTAWRRLEGEINAQVLPDGAQTELTTGYHVGVTNTFFSMAQLARKNGIQPSPRYRERLEKMHEYSALLTKPDGTQPNLGDSWSSNASSSVRRGGRHFDRPDMTFIATKGQQGKRPDYLDTALPHAGYYVMRTAWTDDPDGMYVLLDAAHHWGGWHQHYDALALNLYAGGRTLTPDAGPFCYDHPDRKLFRSTAYHSTVCVDDTNQNTSPCTLHRFYPGHSDQTLSFADASHHGYKDVSHRRQVLFVRPVQEATPYVLVVDRLSGRGVHELDQNWHLPPGAADVTQKQLEAQTTFDQGGNLLIRSLLSENITLRSGVSGITAGYRQQEKRPDICFSQEKQLPALFVTLLLPFDGPKPPDVEVELISASVDGTVQVELATQGARDLICVSPEPAAVTMEGQELSGTAGLVRFREGKLVSKQDVKPAEEKDNQH